MAKYSAFHNIFNNDKNVTDFIECNYTQFIGNHHNFSSPESYKLYV